MRLLYYWEELRNNFYHEIIIRILLRRNYSEECLGWNYKDGFIMMNLVKLLLCNYDFGLLS